jgi:hypothetical protein
VSVCLNTIDLYSEATHCAKSTLENLEDHIAIIGSSYKFWGLATILGEQPEAILLQ